jgi:hypothetical protein
MNFFTTFLIEFLLSGTRDYYLILIINEFYIVFYQILVARVNPLIKSFRIVFIHFLRRSFGGFFGTRFKESSRKKIPTVCFSKNIFDYIDL